MVKIHAGCNMIGRNSGHVFTAVVSGCFTGLLVLGKLDSTALIATGLAIIALTIWARIVTKNHTPLQVTLGLVVGAGSVLVVFPVFIS